VQHREQVVDEPGRSRLRLPGRRDGHREPAVLEVDLPESDEVIEPGHGRVVTVCGFPGMESADAQPGERCKFRPEQLGEGAKSHGQQRPVRIGHPAPTPGEGAGRAREAFRVGTGQHHGRGAERRIVVSQPLDLSRPVALDRRHLVNEPPPAGPLGGRRKRHVLHQGAQVVGQPTVGRETDDRQRRYPACQQRLDRLLWYAF
jgi:hypothetical protein